MQVIFSKMIIVATSAKIDEQCFNLNLLQLIKASFYNLIVIMTEKPNNNERIIPKIRQAKYPSYRSNFFPKKRKFRYGRRFTNEPGCLEQLLNTQVIAQYLQELYFNTKGKVHVFELRDCRILQATSSNCLSDHYNKYSCEYQLEPEPIPSMKVEDDSDQPLEYNHELMNSSNDTPPKIGSFIKITKWDFRVRKSTIIVRKYVYLGGVSSQVSHGIKFQLAFIDDNINTEQTERLKSYHAHLSTQRLYKNEEPMMITRSRDDPIQFDGESLLQNIFSSEQEQYQKKLFVILDKPLSKTQTLPSKIVGYRQVDKIPKKQLREVFKIRRQLKINENDGEKQIRKKIEDSEELRKIMQKMTIQP